MSQTELARRAGVPQPYVSAIENGKEAVFSTYERLLAAMGAALVVAARPFRSADDIFDELNAERAAAKERVDARRYQRNIVRRTLKALSRAPAPPATG